MDESGLVAASQRGDKKAFGLLIDQYYRGVYRVVYQYTGSHHDSDDICQETFLRAYRNIEQLRCAGSFRVWLFRIASNLGREHIKDTRRRERFMLRNGADAAAGVVADKKPGPLAMLSTEEK